MATFDFSYDISREDWHAELVDVQGGPSDTSSEDEDDEFGSANSITLPEACVCQQCRFDIVS
jgi:hypothetical protein